MAAAVDSRSVCDPERRCAFFVAMGAAAGWALGAPGAATAATCQLEVSSGTVFVSLTGESANIAARDGWLRLNNVPCAGADLDVIAAVIVNGSSFNERLTIDLSRGTFTRDGPGSDQICFSIDLGAGDDRLIVVGTAGPDRFRLGRLGLDWDGDDDVEVSIAGYPKVTLMGQGGADMLCAGGDGCLGAAWPSPVALVGGDGDDLLIGGDAGDLLQGNDGDDVIYGGEGNDQIWGGAGDDEVHGGPGDDAFFAEAGPDGSDWFYGDTGSDLVSYQGRSLGVEVTIDGEANDGEPGAEHDNVQLCIERLAGGAGDDILVGSPASNTIAGNGGNDLIDGGDGNDFIRGNDGDDWIFGGDGDDALYGDAGNDHIFGGNHDDLLVGGDGNDELVGGSGRDALYGNSGDDLLDAGYGADFVLSCGPGVDLAVDPDAPAPQRDCE